MSSISHIHSAAELQSLFSTTTYVAIDFFADWCPPCKTITPVFENLASKHAIPGVLAFAKVNVDHSQHIARTYGITAMPTFLFFKDGKKVAVNGQAVLQGADMRGLTAAAEKLGGLALRRKAEKGAST
jgi:thioredoxin 1